LPTEFESIGTALRNLTKMPHKGDIPEDIDFTVPFGEWEKTPRL